MNLDRQPCTDIDTDAIGLMGNIVVPLRSQRASKWHAYGTAGLGVIRGWTNEPDSASPSATSVVTTIAFDGVRYRG